MRTIIFWGIVFKAYVGKPAHIPAGPFSAISVYMQWKMFLYGNLPSAPGICFYNLVLALSNGKEVKAAAPPAKKLAEYQDKLVLPVDLYTLSLISSYVANKVPLSAMALVMVGTAPLHRPLTPSSTGILLKASKKLA